MPRLLVLGRSMHAESPALGRFAFDAGKVERSLAHAMASGLLLVYVTEQGVIYGGFAGVVVERWFSTEKMFTDLAVFVDPSRRGGMAAFRLLREAVAWCKTQGFRPEDVQIGVSTGVHPEETGRLYELVGFERFGGLYRLREF